MRLKERKLHLNPINSENESSHARSSPCASDRVVETSTQPLTDICPHTWFHPCSSSRWFFLVRVQATSSLNDFIPRRNAFLAKTR